MESVDGTKERVLSLDGALCQKRRTLLGTRNHEFERKQMVQRAKIQVLRNAPIFADSEGLDRKEATQERKRRSYVWTPQF